MNEHNEKSESSIKNYADTSSLDSQLSASHPIFGRRATNLECDHYGAAIDRMAIEQHTEDGLSVTISVPFCATRCLTCARASVVTHDSGMIDRYLDALDAEMALITKRIGRGRRLAELNLLGGTPNYLEAFQLARIAGMVEHHFSVDDETVSTVEVNPSRCSVTQFELLRGLGFKNLRCELREVDNGMSAMDARSHSPELLQDTFSSARAAGFERLTVVMNYGLPGQKLESLAETLSSVIDVAPDRILCQPFVRREQLFPHQKLIEAESVPTLSEKLVMFNEMLDQCSDAGYEWIGIDGFVKSGDPLIDSQKNGRLWRNTLGYSDLQSPWTIGFGLGAVSDLSTLLSQNTSDLDAWHQAIADGRHPVGQGVVLDQKESAEMRALSRLGSGLNAHGCDLQAAHPSAVERLGQHGIVHMLGDDVLLTDSGRKQLGQLWGEGLDGLLKASSQG